MYVCILFYWFFGLLLCIEIDILYNENKFCFFFKFELLYWILVIVCKLLCFGVLKFLDVRVNY